MSSSRWASRPSIDGAVSAGLLGVAVGALAIRRQGIYFAMITLALAQMVYFFFISARFSGGENGLQGVPRGSFLGMIGLQDNMAMYYFVLGIFHVEAAYQALATRGDVEHDLRVMAGVDFFRFLLVPIMLMGMH